MERARGKTREEALATLAKRIDGFERYSHPHSSFMAGLATELARRLGLLPDDIEAVAEAALLHDLGLYALSPSYHLNPGPLTHDQRMDLWRHPIIGEQKLAKRNSSRHAQLLVRWHHEWWNGSGYPDMLEFEEIPIGARILRAVELYSALISERPYRGALDPSQATETLKSSAGIECDPYVVKALLCLVEELRSRALDRSSQLSIPDAESAAVASRPEEKGRVLSFEDRSDSNPQGDDGPFSQNKRQDAERLEGAESVDGAPAFELTSDLIAGPAPDSRVPLVESLLAELGSARGERGAWSEWLRSGYNRRSHLGFEASVLRQIEFRSVAIPFCGWARLDWYLRSTGKVVFSNDPRTWAAAAGRAAVDARNTLDDEEIVRLLHDVYVPGNRLENPQLLRWFSETDAWWLDNLRRNIEMMPDPRIRAHAFLLGMLTGDYALSFTGETIDLKRPLATVFWQLAVRSFADQHVHGYGRGYNLASEQFISEIRADLLFLNLPSADGATSPARNRQEWRENWLRPGSERLDHLAEFTTDPQSRQSYLSAVERLLRAGPHIKKWAVALQEVGLGSASDISELIKEFRPVRATYSKDLTEVAGGSRCYVIVAERDS